MSRLARAGLVLVLLCAAGCVVGPRYRTPPPPAAGTGPLVSADPAIETTAGPPDEWWRLYRDPRLDGYVQEAFKANYDLKAAEANLTAARAVLQASRAGLYPSTDVSFQGLRGRDATTNEILELTGRKPETIWLYEDTFNVAYEIDLWGRVRRSIHGARADSQAVQAARDLVKITVAAETARAYAEVCAQGEEIAVAQQSIATVGREAEITANRLNAGAGSQFDLVRAQGLLAQARAALPPLEGRRRAALLELTAILGRAPADAPREALACVTPPKLASALPVGDGLALLRRRPDVREAERRLASATDKIGVAMAELYPKVGMKGFYGGAALTIPELGDNTGLIWGIGPTLSWSFPNQIAVRARIRQARAGAEAALDGFDNSMLQALKETEQALVTYRADLSRRVELADARTRAHQAFDIARAGYIAGSISDLDLLTTEETMINTDAAVSGLDTTLVQDQIAIFKALGGGWRDGTQTAAKAGEPAPTLKSPG